MTNQGPLSGFRDLLSDQMLTRNKILSAITEVFELYGFNPIKTPALERFETLNGKYGEEATTLMYDFEDRGGRRLALRYDHTVPLARLMATHYTSLPTPYKRYVVGDVWRGESPQAGRYREFTQIDVDIVGSDSYLADCEILSLMHDVFEALKLDVTIEVNDRRILDSLGEACGIKDESKFSKFVSVIDKTAKVGNEEVVKEIKQVFGDQAGELVSKLLSIGESQSMDKVFELISGPKAEAAAANLAQIFKIAKSAKLNNVKFNPAIARGLNYYTSTIFETLINGKPSLGSICSGGRFDQLIGQLGGPDVPAVGTSIGLDRLMDGLALGSDSAAQTKTRAYISNLDSSLDEQRFNLAQRLRKAGIPTEIYYSDAKLGKQLQAADKLGIERVIIYGPQEHSKGIVLIKNLKTSSQTEVAIDKIEQEFS